MIGIRHRARSHIGTLNVKREIYFVNLLLQCSTQDPTDLFFDS